MVSVVVPVFNHAAYCRDAVASMLGQTLRDLEVVAVDDGSTDGSATVLEELAAADCRVRVARVPHRGIAAALAHGIGLASGRYIARMDADDLSYSSRLEKQVRFLDAHPGAGAVDCRVELLPSPSTGAGMSDYVAWLNSLSTPDTIRAALFIESPLVHPAVCMTREALAAAGGYRQEEWPEDYALWLRMAAAGFRLAKLPETLLGWRDLPDRLTRRNPEYSQDAILRLKARFLPLIHPRARHGVQCWGAGRMGRRAMRHLEAEGVGVLRWFDIDPSKIGALVRGVPVLPVEALRNWRDDFLLVAVGVRSAKPLIRPVLAELGLSEGRDFIFFA